MEDKKYSVKNLENGKYEISLTIPAAAFEKSYNAMLQNSAKDINLKGFRKGKVPASSIEDQVQGSVLQETFEKVAPNYILQAIMEENIQPIMPAIYKEMPKILIGTDVKFSVTVITAPDFKLPNLKKIKIKKESADVSDEEIAKAIDNMWNQKSVEKKKGKTEDRKDTKSNKKSKKKSDKKSQKKGKPDDKWAKKIAKKYGLEEIKSLNDLKKILKETFQQQKEIYVAKQFHSEVFSKVLEAAKIEIPQEVIDYEAHQREHTFMHRLKDSKTDLKDWLKQNKLTIEELEKAWTEDAKKALEEHFFLIKYAQENKIEPKEDQIESYIKEIKKKNKDFKETPGWRASVESVFVKQNALNELISKFDPEVAKALKESQENEKTKAKRKTKSQKKAN